MASHPALQSPGPNSSPQLQTAYAKKQQLVRKLEALREASYTEAREGQNSLIVDEVTGLLRDAELEIKEQYVADLENQLTQEHNAILNAGSAF